MAGGLGGLKGNSGIAIVVAPNIDMAGLLDDLKREGLAISDAKLDAIHNRLSFINDLGLSREAVKGERLAFLGDGAALSVILQILESIIIRKDFSPPNLDRAGIALSVLDALSAEAEDVQLLRPHCVPILRRVLEVAHAVPRSFAMRILAKLLGDPVFLTQVMDSAFLETQPNIYAVLEKYFRHFDYFTMKGRREVKLLQEYLPNLLDLVESLSASPDMMFYLLRRFGPLFEFFCSLNRSVMSLRDGMPWYAIVLCLDRLAQAPLHGEDEREEESDRVEAEMRSGFFTTSLRFMYGHDLSIRKTSIANILSLCGLCADEVESPDGNVVHSDTIPRRTMALRCLAQVLGEGRGDIDEDLPAADQIANDMI